MVLLNTTFLFHKSVEKAGIEWIKNTYIAQALQNGAKGDPLFTKILGSEEDDPEGAHYALHLAFDSLNDAKMWNISIGDKLRQTMRTHWGEKALTIETFLEVVE